MLFLGILFLINSLSTLPRALLYFSYPFYTVSLFSPSYKEARTQLDLIFGPKFDEEFPRAYLESNTCGDGFWESTGRDNYEHPGVGATTVTTDDDGVATITLKLGDQVRGEHAYRSILIHCITFSHFPSM